LRVDRNKLIELEALRGVAAAIVLLHHFLLVIAPRLHGRNFPDDPIGLVRTPLFAQMTQAHIDYMLSKIPMGRFGEPQEIAALVAWLASEECSFSTGAVFDLSGGRSTY